MRLPLSLHYNDQYKLIKMKFNKHIYILTALLAVLLTNCEKNSSIEDNSILPSPGPGIEDAFELSYWIDIDVRHNNGRGYWFNVADLPGDIVPTEQEIKTACESMSGKYNSNKLYVIYHRQFEIEEAKNVFNYWRTYGAQHGIEIVPTIVLESYATPTKLNFTDQEIIDLANWSKANINDKEFGIYDVYIRQSAGGLQDLQLTKINEQVNIPMVRVGLQPGEKMNTYFSSGVQDTWSAECQGLTNELWENPRYYKGTNKYGRKLLQEWVNERLSGESRKIIWNLIPVAWDYDAPLDPFGYIFPGDNALTNDAPVEGRVSLSQEYIVSWYPAGKSNKLFGGFSCDLHILEANSYGKPETPTFYDQLRSGGSYEGKYAAVMNEIGKVYGGLK